VGIVRNKANLPPKINIGKAIQELAKEHKKEDN
jgi:hypothetical protein